MVVFYIRNPFVFVLDNVAKGVIYIIYAGGVAVIKTLWVVGGVGYGLQLVGGIGISEVVYFYGLSQFFLSVAFQGGDVSVFVIGQVFGILPVAVVVICYYKPTI